jgi:hypothetical protein
MNKIKDYTHLTIEPYKVEHEFYSEPSIIMSEFYSVYSITHQLTTNHHVRLDFDFLARYLR